MNPREAELLEAAEDTPPPEEEAAGAPAWVMTFADLMSLLMCFFVLLLSFSEIEATKFKQMAGALKMAFGVQREVEAPAIPMGTSVIAQHFSPGKPEPTPLDEVRQTTFEQKETVQPPDASEEVLLEQAEALREQLQNEIKQGLIDVETVEDRIVIRIREQGSFPSGSDQLNEDFVPVLRRIRDSLATMPGKIEVVGHTDNVPIRTYRFRSNWDLSAARAGSVLHELMAGNVLDAGRMELKGQGEVQPLVANDSHENRATNRRVEIVILNRREK